MRLGVRLGVGAAALVLLGLGAMALKDYVILHMAGWRGPPVGPNRPVVWQQGPATPVAAPADRPPNIIVILTDDLGFNDISLNGGLAQGTVRTPNIDALGQRGAILGAGYAGNATCAPSRAALLTGRYPTRYGFEYTPVPVQLARLIPTLSPRGDGPRPVFRRDRVAETPPYEQMGVPSTEITLAELLRDAGYHTMHLGKWHLGETAGHRPEEQGFDESLGFIVGAQMFLPENHPEVVNSKQDFDPLDKFLWANLPWSVQYNGGERFHPDAYMTDYLTTQAMAGIRANRNRPFFMYLAYNAPHTPLQALKSDYDALAHITDHRERVYAAMIVALDRSVGRIMAELKAQGLDENTLVVFTSDNGGANYLGLPTLNAPFRGWKLTFFEGGIRVPFLMHWPARIPAGTQLAAPVSHFDIYSTAAAAAGVPLPADRPMDGVDLAPFLTGQAAGRPHQALFWRSGGYRAVRSGDWKLQVLDRPERTWLFDLASDPTERNDLSAARPDIVAALKAELEAHDARQSAPMWPALIEAPVGVDRTGEQRIQPGDTYVTWSN